MQDNKPSVIPVNWSCKDELNKLNIEIGQKVVWSNLSNPLSWDTDDIGRADFMADNHEEFHKAMMDKTAE
jgi:hypothetical protein